MFANLRLRWWAVIAAFGLVAPVSASAALLEANDPGLAAHPMIVVGQSPDSPANHVDPNTTSSPFAGVGSLKVVWGANTYIGSGAVIGPTRILTAAHMFDLDNNGSIDVAPGDVTFYLNYGSDLSHAITAASLYVHPDWSGFNNPSVLDDVAVIELSSPVPAGVPMYALNSDPFTAATEITLVGYGRSGDGVNGYTTSASWTVKRSGKNLASFFVLDDEGSGNKEGFEFDFDFPTKDAFDTVLGLGNTVEVTLGPGDSGGPSFIPDGSGGYKIFGVNTFGFDYSSYKAPLFGSGAGGMLVSSYKSWIESVPEPGSVVIWLVGCGGLGLISVTRRHRRTARA